MGKKRRRSNPKNLRDMSLKELQKEYKAAKRFLKKAPKRVQKSVQKRLRDISIAIRNEKRKRKT